MIFSYQTDSYNYETVMEAWHGRKFKIAEGVVNDFSSPPRGVRGSKSFKVKGIRVSYNRFDESYGYHQTKTNGGAIDNNKNVRITYMETQSDLD